MDTLVSLGSGASFVYSVYALFAMSDCYYKGDLVKARDYMNEFYFESAAMILALITVGKMLEARTKGKTTNAIKSLMELAPKEATILSDGVLKRVRVDKVRKDDIFIVKAGESIPVDGVIIEGSGAVDESALTGESIPVDKKEGDEISAATINMSGYIKARAIRVGNDTTLEGIIRMVSDAAATKAPISKIADKVSGVFVPAVIIIAVITTIIWIALGKDVGFALGRGISVLVISCPCALGLATPVAIMVGNGKAARNGIMFKTAEALEIAGKTRYVVLDKTGTITKGEPEITDIYCNEGVSYEELLGIAYSLEIKSEHPLARAINKYAEEKKCSLISSEDFKVFAGNGLTGIIEGKKFACGNLRFIREYLEKSYNSKNEEDSPVKKGNNNGIISVGEEYAASGKTPIYFAREDKLLGIIAVADVVRSDSISAIRELKELGMHVTMLTGDNEKTANAIGKLAGVDEVIAGVLPEGKEKVIRELKSKGRVAMVGDGINDAPALTQADTGIAIGAGTDIAIESADVVLMKSTLKDVAAAIRISRGTLRNIKENLFWAFFYNVIGIPLAAGAYYMAFGWELSPMFGAFAMSLSSVCVVTNALRLNLLKLYPARGNASGDTSDTDKIFDVNITTGIKSSNDKIEINNEINKEINNEKEKKTMVKTISIKGMMCGHCEASVKKALEAIDGVELAEVSHTLGTAVVTLNEDVSDEILRDAVIAKDFEVTEIN